MANFVNEEDFSAGNVQAASITNRPDAIVPLLGWCPGPTTLEDATSILVKGWYARPDNEAGNLILGESDGSGWTESVLGTLPGTVERISLAFDAEGRPVVAMEVSGAIHVRYWDGAAYVTTNVVAGTSPCLVNRSPDTDFSHVVLFYQSGQAIRYRFMSEDFGVEYDPETTLAAGANLEKAIEGAGGRLHLAYSVWDEVAETYTVDWYSSPVYNPACLVVNGHEETIPLGTESIFVFRGDATIETRCDLECDFLIIGAGGNSGSPTQGEGEASVVWMDAGGLGLDPGTDTPVYRARGGGHGAQNDMDGSGGGSGGGGGGASPSNNSMWTAGGQGFGSQGTPGGGGQSTWGLLDPKRAASGGGGGSGISGTGGTCLQGAPLQAGVGGAGRTLRDWSWDGPKGGDGYQKEANGPTGSVPGGGGAGGLIELKDFAIPAGQTIPIHVGAAGGGGNAGEGGKWGFPGVTGLVAIKVRRVALDLVEPARLSGGVETVLDDYRYHTFLADGTVVVDSPGKAEALVIGGGGGGGSNAGGGGGGGDVREVALAIQVDSAVQVGDGGAGGTGGGAGANGQASSVAEIVAPGGGGGAGAGTAAGSDATGGGGHGDEGAPGAGRAMRGYPGGPGGGYDLTAGGSARHAGGGGGAGDSGDNGATQELTGNPLVDNWGVPPGSSLLIDQQRYRLTVDGGQDYALLGSNVSAGKMFVQGLVVSGHANLNVGIVARAEYSGGGGDPTQAPVGLFNWIDEGDQRWRGLAYLFSLGSEHVLQTYAEDGLQEYSVVRKSNGEVLTDSGTSTAHDGTSRSFGARCEGNPISGTNKQGFFDNLMCFRDKFLTVGNMPAGGTLEIQTQDGTVVNSAVESGGEAKVDLSVFTTGLPLVVPNTGFPRCVVKDSGGGVVADVGGIFFPGGEFDVSGGDLEVRVDNTGPEPIPILGLLQGTDFSELTPGPLRGDGGDGRDLGEDWVQGAGIVSTAGGGGGGGAEIQVAGSGGEGGGGHGAYASGTPNAGTPNTGGGGGGSGSAGVAGGAGGSGLVVVRTDRNPLDTPDGTRFSLSQVDQDVDGAFILDPNVEVLSFGDNTDLNALTAFTLVLRFQPDFLNVQRYVWSRWDATNNKRQAAFFQRNNGVELALGVSQTGADYGVLWNSTGWKGTDCLYAMAYDGSLGGTNGMDRLRAYRREPAGSWVDIGWDFSFFQGRSDIPTSLVSVSGVRELLGGREDGGNIGSPGKVRLMAFKAGQRYTPAELDAMTLEDTPNVDPVNWDRLYRFGGNVADEIGEKHGSFATPPA